MRPSTLLLALQSFSERTFATTSLQSGEVSRKVFDMGMGDVRINEGVVAAKDAEVEQLPVVVVVGALLEDVGRAVLSSGASLHMIDHAAGRVGRDCRSRQSGGDGGGNNADLHA